MNNKQEKKECCKIASNKLFRSKTPTYREIYCKKCGYIFRAITGPIVYNK